MLVYIILALVCCLFAMQENGVLTKKTMVHLNIALVIFLLIVGFRYRHGDYGTYEAGFNSDVDVGGDAGYYDLQLLFHHLGMSFQIFVFAITLFSVYAFRKAFRITLWPLFAMVVVLGKIFTLYAMSGIRQYIAMAICWWALSELLLYKRRLWFIIAVLAAYTIHGSALIFLPAVFFVNLKYKKKYVFLILVVSMILASFYLQFFDAAFKASDFIDDRMSSYVEQAGEENTSMNAMNYIENFVFLFLALLARGKAVKKIPFYDFFLYLFIIYCGFLIVGNEIGIIKRLRDYYAISYAIIVPGIMYLFKTERLQKFWRYAMIAYFIFLFFRSMYIFDAPFPPDTYGRMIPYHSIIHMYID